MKKIKTNLKTADNVKIAINLYRNKHKSVLIIAHGWFMNKDSKYFSEMAEAFNENYDVITMDFRGHGESSGFYTFTSKEPEDLKTVVNFAKRHYKTIYLMGFSLGAALVLIQGGLEQDVDKVIAVSAPYSFRKIENQVWRRAAWLQTFKKIEVKRWLTVRPSLVIQKKISPIDVVKKIQVPTLFIAGKLDPTIHAWHSKMLYKKALCKKHFELFNKGFHAEDLFIYERERFLSLCNGWLLQNEYVVESGGNAEFKSFSH